MDKRQPSLALIIIGSGFLQSCSFRHGLAETRVPPPAIIDASEQYVCADPRPEICTQEYLPVCGQLREGDLRTYSNGCTACSDESVVSYVPGKCP
jgi:hypothetical protein